MKKWTNVLGLTGLALAMHASAAPQPQLPLEVVSEPLVHVTQDLKAPEQLRELSLPAAKALLASPEGPAWSVYGVQAPACKPKATRKACAAARRECRTAQKYAKKIGAPFACSALYQSTTVRLTTARKPKPGPQVQTKQPLEPRTGDSLPQ